jgi:hypothetical protein
VKKPTFAVENGIFSIQVLKIFTKETGTLIIIENVGYVECGEFFDEKGGEDEQNQKRISQVHEKTF